MIKVEAINNEEMWIDEKRVVMVGPLMDRGLRQLGRAVLYFDGLPPLPCKELMDELAWRVENGVKDGNVVEDPKRADDSDESASRGSETKLVVEA